MVTVVIVDDHPAIRLAMKMTLESQGGFQIVSDAATGPAALAAVREHSPELLILDLELPGMPGLAVIERIRSSGSKVKLLVVSAQQEAIFATRAMQAGADGFVSKSEDLLKVAEAARSIMAGYSVFPSSALVAFSHQGAESAVPTTLSTLTDRELVVVQYLARGMNNKEIGDLLLISNKTVSSFKARIFDKLGISSIVELIDFARSHHLIT